MTADLCAKLGRRVFPLDAIRSYEPNKRPNR
jgi:hypothetical protein